MSSDMCVCPYNKSHVVSRLKFPHHLVKCKVQYPNIQLIPCPYNATHLYTKEAMEIHIRECSDKVLIEPWKYNINGTRQHGDLTPTPFNEDTREIDSDEEAGWN